MKNRLPLLALALVSCDTTPAGYYHGRVTDETGRPLAGVVVAEARRNQPTTTDPHGYFTLPRRQDGAGALVFRKAGYQTDTLPAEYHPAGEATAYQFINADTTVVRLRGAAAQAGPAHPGFTPAQREFIRQMADDAVFYLQDNNLLVGYNEAYLHVLAKNVTASFDLDTYSESNYKFEMRDESKRLVGHVLLEGFWGDDPQAKVYVELEDQQLSRAMGTSSLVLSQENALQN